MVAQSHYIDEAQGDDRVIAAGGRGVEKLGRAGLPDFMERSLKTVARSGGSVVGHGARPLACIL